MNKFNIGDEVVSIWEPDKVGTIKSIDTMSHPEPKYTIVYPNGDEYANYGACFKLVASVDDVLEKGKILVEEEFWYDEETEWGIDVATCAKILIVSYSNRIFYHKVINGETAEFKELTRDER